ncbi:WXG100 family type VII secretion target [Nonomuraea polychroma]|uniref:WXG100 family type VII secretion target n=1 Tax=Nonomuraea polychroma TaxID=46176 RepID=UPI003D8A524A
MNHKDAFSTAATTATMAAGMIWQPWAWYVAAAIGTFVSDPDGMEESARNWRTSDKGGVTTELDDLITELNTLKDQLKNKATWEGGAFQTFEGVHSTFIESVEQLKTVRDDTGDAVDSNAAFLKVVAVIALAIAGLMLALGIYLMVWRLHPLTAPFAIGGVAAVGQTILTAVKGFVTKNWKVAAVVAGIMLAAAELTRMTGQVFPTLEAVPSATPFPFLGLGGSHEGLTNLPQSFMNDGMTYEEGAGLMQTGDYSPTGSSEADQPTGGGGGGPAQYT